MSHIYGSSQTMRGSGLGFLAGSEKKPPVATRVMRPGQKGWLDPAQRYLTPAEVAVKNVTREAAGKAPLVAMVQVAPAPTLTELKRSGPATTVADLKLAADSANREARAQAQAAALNAKAPAIVYGMSKNDALRAQARGIGPLPSIAEQIATQKAGGAALVPTSAVVVKNPAPNAAAALRPVYAPAPQPAPAPFPMPMPAPAPQPMPQPVPSVPSYPASVNAPQAQQYDPYAYGYTEPTYTDAPVSAFGDALNYDATPIYDGGFVDSVYDMVYGAQNQPPANDGWYPEYGADPNAGASYGPYYDDQGYPYYVDAYGNATYADTGMGSIFSKILGKVGPIASAVIPGPIGAAIGQAVNIQNQLRSAAQPAAPVAPVPAPTPQVRYIAQPAAKKDNTLLYVGGAVVLALLLTRK